jgi:radical SAM superfamily enzyme YgiQ (UPF0313 family)
MAKIVFIQRLWHEYPGIGYLSAILRRHGHSTRVIIEESPNKVLKHLLPGDIAAFSVTTGMHHWALDVASHIKKNLGLMIIFGGPHPTYFPEMIEKEPVDIICMGEGEYALLDLANALDRGSDITKIPNLWVKAGGTIHKNPLRPLVDDLDALPFQDRQIYYDSYPMLKKSASKVFMAGRGCPFECSFCFNEKLKNMYSGLGRYVRLRSPSNVIDEIRSVIKNYPLKTIFFNDDIFTMDREWLKQFLPLYKDSVGLPFCIQARVNTLNADSVKLLKEAGCRSVSFAIESGDENIRKGLLGKNITDREITEAAALLKKYGIAFATYNMIGIPDETVEDAFKTVDMNIEIGTDYPRCSFLTPYPGTRIAAYARKMGYLEAPADSIAPFSQQTDSIIKLADKDRMINIHSFFQTMVIFPAVKPFIKKLIQLPPNIFFRMWWALIYAIIFTRSELKSFRDIIPLSIRSLGSITKR